MSNHLAIATVTAALQQRLQEAINQAVSGASLILGPPRSAETGFVGCHLCLYQTGVDASLRNCDLPTWDSAPRSASGSAANPSSILVARPRVPLILNYLIAFYGERDLAAERMMGSVVGQLHSSPILARDQIEKVIESNAFLAGSDLASQPESIKLTPVYLSLEDLSKLWTVFFQVAHRLSLIYQVSVVMIEADQEPEVLLKVQQVNTSASLLTPPPVPNPGAA